MDSSHVGMGVVIINNAFSIDKDVLLRYMNWLSQGTESAFQISENGEIGINKTGFKFDKEGMALAPGRFLDLDGTISGRIPANEFLTLRDQLENAAYRCLVEYCHYFPDAATTCWWRPNGHIAYYSEDQRIGPHCDDQIPFEWGQSPINQVSINNSVSINLYLNSCEEDYYGGEINFPQVPYIHKPVLGSAVLYPSNYIGRHEVLPVIEGLRIAFLTIACYGVDPGVIIGQEQPHRRWMPDLISEVNQRERHKKCKE